MLANGYQLHEESSKISLVDSLGSGYHLPIRARTYDQTTALMDKLKSDNTHSNSMGAAFMKANQVIEDLILRLERTQEEYVKSLLWS